MAMRGGEMPLDAFGWAIVIAALAVGAFTVYSSIVDEDTATDGRVDAGVDATVQRGGL